MNRLLVWRPAALVRVAAWCSLVSLAALTTTAARGADSSGSRLDVPGMSSQDLVQAALAAELAGDNAKRESLLGAACEAPDAAAEAKWQSGLVEFDGQWQMPEDVAAAVAGDEARQQYRQLRSQRGDSVEDHRELADWCQKNGLKAQERYHLKQVLAEVPDDKAIQVRLGLRPFRGRLGTDEQVKAALDREQQQAAATKRYQRKFKTWLNEAATADNEGRAAVVERFREIRDEGALDALLEASRDTAQFQKRLERRMGREAGAAYWNELCLAMLDSVSSMPQFQATYLLAEAAVFSGNEAVRSAAAAALKERRPTDYMPLLLGSLTSLIEADIDLTVSPLGDVSYMASYRESGVDNDRKHVDSFEAVTVLQGEANGQAMRQYSNTVNMQIRRARTLAAVAERQVAATNAQREEANARIIAALVEITGEDLGDDPVAWRERWAGFNDIYYPEEKPVEETANRSVDYQYVYTLEPATVEPTERPATRRSAPNSSPRTRARPRPRVYECFAVGTPVWTEQGPQRIELLSPGDMVLSQNPLTGELGYRPILDTTVRPPTKFMELNLSGGEQIYATRGHRFWVNGEGWCMARFLKSGLALHSTGGAVGLTKATLLDGEEAYNLIVDEFHTYFVGESKVLVHDSTCPEPTLAPIPGMNAVRATKSLAEGL